MARSGDEFVVSLLPLLGHGKGGHRFDLREACGRLAPQRWAADGERQADAKSNHRRLAQRHTH
jgi:hypothetical protein